jgi:hypothetical protein
VVTITFPNRLKWFLSRILIFQDGRFRFKIDPLPDSLSQPKAGGLLHMECDFAAALPYNLDFKTDELNHLPFLWQFMYY